MATIPDIYMKLCECNHKLWDHNLSSRTTGDFGAGCLASSCHCTSFRSRPVSGTTTIPTVGMENEREHENMSDKKYLLPGGKEYIARDLPGFENDVEGLRELVKTGNHVLILGDPGTGKTALTMAAFPDAENDIFHSKMTAPDMLWRPRIDPDAAHGVTYDPAPLTRAAQKGCVYYGDEIMRGNEDAVTPLFSAMDGRGIIIGGNLDGTDLVIQPGFGVVAASNPLVRGAFLPDAIASRFHILTVETNEKLLLKLKLAEELVTIWKNLKGSNEGDIWSPSIRDLLKAQAFLDADNIPQAAFALTGFRVPSRDREAVAGVVALVLGTRVTSVGGVIK